MRARFPLKHVALTTCFIVFSGLAIPSPAQGQFNELRGGSLQPWNEKGAALQPGLVEPAGLVETVQADSRSMEMTSLPELDLSKFARRAAWLLVAVLSACMAILLLIRRFRLECIFQQKKPVADGSEKKIRLEATLRLGGSRILEIVQGDHGRIAVVSDGKGIHAVTLIDKSFREELAASRSRQPEDLEPVGRKEQTRSNEESSNPAQGIFRRWHLVPRTGIPGAGL